MSSSLAPGLHVSRAIEPQMIEPYPNPFHELVPVSNINPMVTHANQGIFKPKAFIIAYFLDAVLTKPWAPKEALFSPEWQKAIILKLMP